MKLRISYTLFLFLLLAVILSAGCSGVKGTFYPSSPDKDGSPSQSAVFPHKSDWVDPSVHGKFVLDSGTTACRNACHGDNLEGGGARACKACHPVYPHQAPEVWQGLSGHGKFVRENGGAGACATKCHGADLAGGYDPAGKKSCTKCHKSYPGKHAETGWNLKGHGLFIGSIGSSSECTTMCHRPDVPEGLKLKDCADCHKSYPAPHAGADWKDAGHKGFLSMYGGIVGSDCTTCHGQKLEGSAKAGACATSACHHAGPEDRWKDGAIHGPAATSALSKCLVCHGSDLKGNAVIKGCDECHHKNWTDTHAKPWVAISEHGRQGTKPATSCKLCHGAGLEGGVSGISCFACHDLYPHIVEWKLPEKHGAAAKQDPAECQTCHGTDFSGGESGKPCSVCHPYVSHKWEEKQHGKYVLTADDKFSKDAYSANCKVCHGELYSLNVNWPSGPLDTASGNPMCYKCHPAYPHYEYISNSSTNGEVIPWPTDSRAHRYYLGQSNAGYMADSTKVLPNCGGATGGLCHKDVRHFMQKQSISYPCNILCHSPKP